MGNIKNVDTSTLVKSNIRKNICILHLKHARLFKVIKSKGSADFHIIIRLSPSFNIYTGNRGNH